VPAHRLFGEFAIAAAELIDGYSLVDANDFLLTNASTVGLEGATR
jgi:hypothetical protein